MPNRPQYGYEEPLYSRRGSARTDGESDHRNWANRLFIRIRPSQYFHIQREPERNPVPMQHPECHKRFSDHIRHSNVGRPDTDTQTGRSIHQRIIRRKKYSEQKTLSEKHSISVVQTATRLPSTIPQSAPLSGDFPDGTREKSDFYFLETAGIQPKRKYRDLVVLLDKGVSSKEINQRLLPTNTGFWKKQRSLSDSTHFQGRDVQTG